MSANYNPNCKTREIGLQTAVRHPQFSGLNRLVNAAKVVYCTYTYSFISAYQEPYSACYDTNLQTTKTEQRVYGAGCS